MLGASQAALFGAASAAVTYDSLVNLFDPDLVSYWKFGNDGTDEKGTESASVTGDPELNVPTIVQLDTTAEGALAEGIAWPGSSGVFAEAPHNLAHKTREGTIIVTFQRDSATQKSTLVAADANAAAGGLSVELTQSGEPRAYLRRQSDGRAIILLGQAGDVQLNKAYTLIFKWGSAGLSLALWDDGGTLVRRLTDPLSDGVTGTSPIRFGIWHDGIQSPHDGPFGPVIWLKRRISDAEEQILARARTIEREVPTGEVTRLGAWPLSETSGNAFADSLGGNTATLSVPSWTTATHEHNRPGIAAGTDHALEVSNGGPAIPMVPGYKQGAMSLAVYVEPRAQVRGRQYWNETHEKFGREFIAHCDDGSTPGSFAIERRLKQTGYAHDNPSSWEWRLDGYVRDGSGVAQRFSGGLNGISGALLPVDVAKRVVLTQGPAGAKLYLDGSLVASLPSVTQGWTALSTAITLGSSSDPGHANERSPLWGRMDQIEVWQGQLALADVQSRPAAAQSLFYRIPTDGPLFNVASYANLQAAMDAASAGSGYVYQDASDPTWYVLPFASDEGMLFKPGCRGMVGVRIKRPAQPTNNSFLRMVTVTDTFGAMGGHGDRYAGSGGYKFIGCKWDCNARSCDWHPFPGQPGYTYHAFDVQQRIALYLESASTTITILIDACEFYENQSDAFDAYRNVNVTAKSCRFYGCFRGGMVNGGLPVQFKVQRCEAFEQSPFWPGVRIGCGLDVEPFQFSGNSTYTFLDCWSENDFDDQAQRSTTVSIYRNCHTVTPGFYLIPAGEFQNDPVARWEAYYCTFPYHRRGGEPAASNFPAAGWWDGFAPGTNGTGVLFDHCIFVANGTPYVTHGDWGVNTPSAGTTFFISFGTGATTGRLCTLRTCEFRARNLPAGIPRANVRCWSCEPMSTASAIELDGVIIDGAFADIPLSMGGVTVRHRNVLHERTGDTTPWTGAGAEVAI